jgi:tetratricopeptide (TPR) repeat protein
MMKPLGTPDSHYLNAAQGWLELGDAQSAVEEVTRISTAGQLHPEVLAVRWEFCARDHDWDGAHTIAQIALDLAADQPGPWIQRSFALHELKLTEDAYECLLPAAERFPEETTIAYNLACYCCQLGQPEKALAWFAKAQAAGDPDRLKAMALQDPDLAPLRAKIERL